MALDFEYLRKDKCGIFGENILELMDNKGTPILDLFIRESIQNSLDAVKKNATSVRVDFNIDEFDIDSFCDIFSELKLFVKMHHSDKNHFIIFSDKNTVGLTGDTKGDLGDERKDQHFNKLVFHVLKPQEKKDAGGSKGVGKSLYFTIGIGFVIFYSRIKLDNGSYEHRLACTLVENTKDQKRLLIQENNSGIAFWGKYYDSINRKVGAVTDEQQIARILSLFGTSLYNNDETGTQIIIPFIDPPKLIERSTNRIDDKKRWWESDLKEYLSLSILRWYFPRLSHEYKGPYLEASVCKERIAPDDNAPVFKYFQNIYEYVDEEAVIHEEIRRERDLLNPVLGYFNYREFDDSDFDGIHPCDYLLMAKGGHVNSEANHPIVGFCRKPGMVVCYKSIDSIKLTPGKHVLGMFTLNSDNIITSSKETSLNEYIRAGEKSDHAEWYDHQIVDGKNIYLVDHINRSIKKILERRFSEKKQANSYSSLAEFYSSFFAKKLLPDNGFGHGIGSGPGNDTGNGRGERPPRNKNAKNKATLENIIYKNGCMELEYSVSLSSKAKRIVFSSSIQDGNGTSISPKSWEEDGSVYPLYIKKISMLTDSDESFVFDTLKEYKNIEYDLSVGGNRCIGFKLDRKSGHKNFKMKIRLATNDKLLKYSFSIKFTE